MDRPVAVMNWLLDGEHRRLHASDRASYSVDAGQGQCPGTRRKRWNGKPHKEERGLRREQKEMGHPKPMAR